MDFDKQKEGGQSGLKALKRSKTVSLSFFFEFHPYNLHEHQLPHSFSFFLCCTTKVYKKINVCCSHHYCFLLPYYG